MTPKTLGRPVAPARPNPLAAVAARPAEITICAEYLALTIARRRGWGTERAELLAELTGLPVRHLVGLLRGADHGAVAARGALLRGVTGWGGVNCSIDRCVQQVHARGLCSSHYRRWWRYGDPLHPSDRWAAEHADDPAMLDAVDMAEQAVREMGGAS